MKTSPDELFSFFNEIGIINQLGSTKFERLLPDGLTLSQFSVLNNFVRLGGTRTPLQLANAFQVSKGAMTNTIAKLEIRGCVKVTPSTEDGRKKEINITAKGRKLRNTAIALVSPALVDMCGDISIEKIRAAMPLLQEVRAYLDNDRNPAT